MRCILADREPEYIRQKLYVLYELKEIIWFVFLNASSHLCVFSILGERNKQNQEEEKITQLQNTPSHTQNPHPTPPPPTPQPRKNKHNESKTKIKNPAISHQELDH